MRETVFQNFLTWLRLPTRGFMDWHSQRSFFEVYKDSRTARYFKDSLDESEDECYEKFM